MSIITDLIVHTGWSEPATAVRRFVNWFDEDDNVRGGIARLAARSVSSWGGHYRAHAVLWGGSYNHFPLEQFLEHMEEIEWVAPHLLQVLVLHEDHARLSVYMLEGRRFTQIVDSGGSTDDVPDVPRGEMWFEDEELRSRFGG